MKTTTDDGAGLAPMDCSHDAAERRRAIRKRWRSVDRWNKVHDDGSFIVGTENGVYLHMPDGKTKHGPFEYIDDARNFHANNALTKPHEN